MTYRTPPITPTTRTEDTVAWVRHRLESGQGARCGRWRCSPRGDHVRPYYSLEYIHRDTPAARRDGEGEWEPCYTPTHAGTAAAWLVDLWHHDD